MAIYAPPDTIDKEIYSLVELLNQTGYIRTTSSCAGVTPLEDGTYRRHSKEAYAWISFEPNGASQACAHLLEYVSKRLANAHDRGIRHQR